MEKLKKYGNSIWRVPLIAVIAGFLYAPIYTRIVLGFGIIQPGVIDKRVSLFADAGITMAVLILGGMLLLRGHIYFCICAFCLWNTSASGSITSWCGNGTWSYCVYVPVEAAGMDGLFRGFFFLFEGTLWFFPPVDRLAEMLGPVSVCAIRAYDT